MKIKTDLKREDYQKLIRLAQEEIVNHKSHLPAILEIGDKKIIADMECNGIKLDEGGRTITGKYVPPKMKFIFKIYFESDSIDLVRDLLDSKNVFVDDNKYYVGDYLYRNITNKAFNIRMISYNLFEEEKYEYNK